MRESLAVACGAVMMAAGLAFAAPAAEQAPAKHPLAQEHPIVVDARGIIPPIAWSVPGVTEPIQSVRDRMVTDKVTTLQLRPGKYMFMTTIFSFEFTVSLDGKLDYMKTIDGCVGGRGTATLMVTCRKMQPVDP
ncbi:MAG: hypothetical protein EPO02_01075 [Nitrospirae bacterium]|nr:MAG: hypothetical protein EPO02_01075 [Nitrospirota bacterium]